MTEIKIETPLAECDAYSEVDGILSDHGCFDTKARDEITALLLAVDAASRKQAQADRDMEWWRTLVLVDSVPPTPEAAKDWLARLSAHEQQEAAKQAQEPLLEAGRAALKIAEGWIRSEPEGTSLYEGSMAELEPIRRAFAAAAER